MAVKLQTIKDIRTYISSELSSLYTVRETAAITNIIISHVLGVDRVSQLASGNDMQVEGKKAGKIMRICRSLKAGKPVQYAVGETLFFNCKIRVGPGVLIPRPETEELVDLVIRENPRFRGSILDIGTGSGCIAIALAANLPEAGITAVDISRRALRAATENAGINRVKIGFVRDDILSADPAGYEQTDIIVSNPPYVTNSERIMIKSNVIDHEPRRALFVPDSDPLKFYRAILELAGKILKPGGKVYFEINETRGEEVRLLINSYGYSGVTIIRDINGKDRIARGIKK
ncbi:MAG: peptide chain release factor N(5)-glutamine methyltransferase [Bacteroidales bacterium]